MLIRILTSAGAEKSCLIVNGGVSFTPKTNGTITTFRFGAGNNATMDINRPYTQVMQIFEDWLIPKANQANFGIPNRMLTIRETS